MRSDPIGRESLGTDEVHVWTARPGDVTDPALIRAYESLEDQDDRERRLRLRFARHRHERLVSVALVRTTLSRYADLDPAAWRFERNEHGRPDLIAGQCALDLRFNLSHAESLVTCAVTVGRDIGVDVECMERRGETVAIADRYFSPIEVRDLHAVPPEGQRERFFQYWTLKESYIKARGMGLRIPLRKFSFHLEDPRAIRISIDPALGDDARSWQFALRRPDPRHMLAVGIRRGAGRDLDLLVRETIPLDSTAD